MQSRAHRPLALGPQPQRCHIWRPGYMCAGFRVPSERWAPRGSSWIALNASASVDQGVSPRRFFVCPRIMMNHHTEQSITVASRQNCNKLIMKAHRPRQCPSEGNSILYNIYIYRWLRQSARLWPPVPYAPAPLAPRLQCWVARATRETPESRREPI